MNTTALILPGIGNSGPQHWQTLWQQAQPGFGRVEQADWDHPLCAVWVSALELAVQRAGPGVVLVAHSLACLVVAHWAAQCHAPIKGALLVALPDPQGPNFPPEAVGFARTPTLPFAFPSTLVVSADDPYGSPEHSSRLARAWGSHCVDIGACGHINAASGLGDWPQGLTLFEQLHCAAS